MNKTLRIVANDRTRVMEEFGSVHWIMIQGWNILINLSNEHAIILTGRRENARYSTGSFQGRDSWDTLYRYAYAFNKLSSKGFPNPARPTPVGGTTEGKERGLTRSK